MLSSLRGELDVSVVLYLWYDAELTDRGGTQPTATERRTAPVHTETTWSHNILFFGSAFSELHILVPEGYLAEWYLCSYEELFDLVLNDHRDSGGSVRYPNATVRHVFVLPQASFAKVCTERFDEAPIAIED